MNNTIKTFVTLIVVLTMGGYALAKDQKLDKTKIPDNIVVLHAEITIDKPASEVWPHLVNFSSWFATDYIVKHVSGEPGEEGEIQALYSSKIPIKDQQNPLLLKAIKIVPNKLFFGTNIPITYNDQTISGDNILQLSEFDGKTKVVAIMTKKIQSLTREAYDSGKHSLESGSKAARIRWETDYFPRLKMLVED